jgi:hypothetical protein
LPKRTKTKNRPNQKRTGPRPGQEFPIMPLVVGGVFTVVLIVLVVAFRITTGGTQISGQPVANIRCDSSEQLQVHYHAHIDLIADGAPVSIPAQTGILGSCFYWMHTHTTTGIIHIEAPKDSATRQFTVGDFFAVWRQPMNRKQVATFPIDKTHQVKVWVDGKPYTGDPAKAVLRSHTQVVIEVGPNFVDPPTYDWTSSEATSEAGTGG